MSSHGYQVGGIVGFLKTLHKVINDTHPKAIYVAWESGGSSRRRSLFSEYKANRKPEKLNRFYEDDIPDTEENKSQQIRTLAKLLKLLPVCQVYVPNCEGDDVIAFLAKRKFAAAKKLIVSSDKDFYQLLDDSIEIYNLHKKIIIKKEDVIKEYKITPQNFALAKAFCGDVSDNIPGIDGIGFKTLVKRIPLFGSERDVLIDEVIDYCTVNQKKSGVYSKVLESIDLIKRNWQLVYLDSTMISASQISKIEFIVDNYKPSANKVEFMKLLIEEGITTFDVESLFYAFLLVGYTKHNV
jgi:5'-3' exonuclease